MDVDTVRGGVCVHLDHSGPHPILRKEVERLVTHKLSVVHLQDVLRMRCRVVIVEEVAKLGAARDLHSCLDLADGDFIK